ncbi:MAG: PqqD family protein [Gemmatimonadales bacterium]
MGEIIDGEAVIMDLTSGHYYSALGSGAVIWSAVEAGCDRTGAVDHLAAVYPVPRATLEAAVDSFVSELLSHGLVVESGTPTPDAEPSFRDAGAEFAPPVLEAYSDMEDLLLLDPVHDVDAVGWPVPKPATDGK